MRKLRIAMVIDVWDAPGGGIISTKRFTELLRRQGHEVTVVSTGKKEEGKVVLKSFYPFLGKKIMKKMKITFAWPEEEKIKEVLGKVDLVHIQLPFYLGIKTIGLAREKNLPVVTSFHVQAENITRNLGISSEKAVKQLYKFFISKIYNKSDVVICPSRFAEEELEKYGLEVPSKIVSNGYTEEYHPRRLKKKYPHSFVVMMVGRLAAEKRQEKLIEAVALSKHKKDIRIVLVGEGPLKKKLKKMGSRLPNKPIFLSGLSNMKLAQWYNAADLYVHTGEVELEGMALLEAMACGITPVISDAQKSASRQFALDERSLFTDAEDLAAKINYWYEHPMELMKAKENYLESAKQFNINFSLKRLEDTYFEAIELNKKRKGRFAETEENGRAWTALLKKISPFVRGLNGREKKKQPTNDQPV